MNIREFFRRKPVVRPESVKDVKTTVVMVDFPEWIETLKREYANATIKVKRTKIFLGETPAYVGNPIPVSNIEAATFDRVLYELYGGGIFLLEYWQGSHRLMMKNSKPQIAVTHTISVEGEPKQLGGRKAAIAQIAAQPKTVLGLLLKQLDTIEGITALTALLALAKDFFITGKKESGGNLKDMVESMGTIFGMIPAPPDEIEQLERYQKLSGLFQATNKPPVNIGGSSGSSWDGVAKVIGQVLGTAIANAQNNGGQKPGMLQTPEGQASLPLAGTPPGGEAGIAASATAPSPAESATPQAKFMNAKIMSIQAAMEAKLDPLSIANDLWSLLIFIMEKQIVDEKFVQSLYANPNRALDQLIKLYAPQSASYPKLDEVKRVVVQYIQEDAQEEVETHAEETEDRVIKLSEPTILKGEERVRILEKGESEGSVSQAVRKEPIVISPEEPVVIVRDESGEFMPAAPGEEQITLSGEDSQTQEE